MIDVRKATQGKISFISCPIYAPASLMLLKKKKKKRRRRRQHCYKAGLWHSFSSQQNCPTVWMNSLIWQHWPIKTTTSTTVNAPFWSGMAGQHGRHQTPKPRHDRPRRSLSPAHDRPRWACSAPTPACWGRWCWRGRPAPSAGLHTASPTLCATPVQREVDIYYTLRLCFKHNHIQAVSHLIWFCSLVTVQ